MANDIAGKGQHRMIQSNNSSRPFKALETCDELPYCRMNQGLKPGNPKTGKVRLNGLAASAMQLMGVG
ncbi:hypothetical protein PG993_013287 [Apiospora rasikravindrae]|uniref:Uncharacterized protein n=1 Tax=Apiospora rasikravindrae TaxID=990691 RepID=A0ABR1RYL9_9PEZI